MKNEAATGYLLNYGGLDHGYQEWAISSEHAVFIDSLGRIPSSPPEALRPTLRFSVFRRLRGLAAQRALTAFPRNAWE